MFVSYGISGYGVELTFRALALRRNRVQGVRLREGHRVEVRLYSCVNQIKFYKMFIITLSNE